MERFLFMNVSRWDMLKRFEWIERRQISPVLCILVLWVAFILPPLGIRSFHYEEGYVVGVARSAIEHGNWLTPHLYGWRFVERPHLMAWTVAALGWVFGGVNQWIARAPAVLSLLGGGLLIFSLVRRYASALAALFAAGCFIVSPMMLQKVVTAEPDVMVSVILFGTFIVWWNGAEHGPIAGLRWLAIGALLALAALVKGPQPIAYFGLGAGAFHLWRRQWLDLVGLACAGAIAAAATLAWYWAVYQPGDLHFWLYASKIGLGLSPGERLLDSVHLFGALLLDAMPAVIVAAPFAVLVLRSRTTTSDELAVALLLYAVIVTAALVAWPGARDRYAMPGMLALAALAGLAFERFRVARPRLVNAALVVGAALIGYQVALSWLVMPAAPDLFRSSRIAASTITSVVATRPATLYMDVDSLNKNVLAYLPEPVRVVPFDDLLQLKSPAWLLMLPESARKLASRRSDLQLHAIIRSDGVRELFELRPQ